MNSLTVYDYGFRIYNPAIGKFLSVDPLTQSYPWYTPYQFAANMPIWAIDLDGLEEKKATSYTVIYDRDGNLISKPTVVNIANNVINVNLHPGFKPLGGNRVEVTPGEFTLPDGYSHQDLMNTNVFRQISGELFTWQRTQSGGLPQPPPTNNLVQKNDDNDDFVEQTKIIKETGNKPVISWRKGTETIVAPLINQTYITANLDISFQYNKGSNNGTAFSNDAQADASISAYAQRLKANGLSSVDITITADYKSFGEPVKNHGTVGALIEARGNNVKDAFAKYGITINSIVPDLGKPGVSASSTTTVGVQIGWNSTTYPIRQKTVDGKSTGPVQRTGAGTATPQIGGTKPAGGRRWGG